jgi:hypothetical protein
MSALLLAGCATGPAPKTHYSLRDDPDSRPIDQVALLPVDVDVYEMSAGGLREEVPHWSERAEQNVRSALLVSRDETGGCCVSRTVDTSTLDAEERAALEEHLALFGVVVSNVLWTGLPQNSAWKFKAEHFDYTLGDGLRFLKEKYDVDAGLIILGEDVVSTAGRKATAVVGAAFGVAVPLGHSVLIGGLVDFKTGDLLWMNHSVSTGSTDLRDPTSCRSFARALLRGYPGLPETRTED